MKGSVFVALLLISLGAVNSQFSMDNLVKEIYQHKMKENVGELNECKICLSFVDTTINYALNIFLNAGVAETCQVGCADIAQKFFNGTEIEQIVDVACTMGCLVLGIKEFVNVLQKIDIDPIYYCEELKVCPINDYGKAEIDQVKISPSKAAQGTTFDIEIDYTVINTTGTADILMIIHTVDKIPVEAEFMLYQEKPNKYREMIQLNATPNPDCDTICEQWLAGNYVIDIYLCDGQCHSKHLHHKIYDVKHVNFTITG